MSEACIHGFMAIVDFDSVKGLDIITQDAYILGEILDIRFEDLTWNIQGFKVKSESKVSKMINVGSGKSMVLLHPGKYVINDVVLLPDTIDTLGMKVTADNLNNIADAIREIAEEIRDAEMEAWRIAHDRD